MDITQAVAKALSGKHQLPRDLPDYRGYVVASDYAQELRDAFDALEQRALKELRAILILARGRLIARVLRGSLEPQGIRLAGLKDFRMAVRDLLERASRRGGLDARKEVREGKRAVREYGYNPNQPRDEQGQWTGGSPVFSSKEIEKGLVALASAPEAQEGYRHFDDFENQTKPPQVWLGDIGFTKGNFLYGGLPQKDDKRWTEITVPLKDLGRAQSSVIRSAVADKLKGLNTRGLEGGALPDVVLDNGKFFLQTGHHRAAAAVFAGRTSIQANVVERTGKKSYKRPSGGHRKYAAPAAFRPRNAAKWMREKEFYVTDLLDKAITGNVRGILVNGLKTGELNAVVADKIWTEFERYIGDPSILRDGEPLSPARLETIVRTNLTDAYNHGRMMEYTSDEMLPFLNAIRYSAILDERTTPVCAFLDGKMFDPIDPDLTDLLPPNHFNCRSIVVPVVVGEVIDQEDFITPEEVGHAKELADAKFLAYNPDQPRDPKGTSTGGQWSGGGAGRVVEIASGNVDKELLKRLGGPREPSKAQDLRMEHVTGSKDEQNFVDTYGGKSYSIVANKRLREGKTPPEVEAWDKAFTPIKKDVTVFRVMTGNKEEIDAFTKPGVVISNAGYTSTSFGVENVSWFLGSTEVESVVLRIGVKKGSRAAPGSAGEAELVLARGTKLRVTKVHSTTLRVGSSSPPTRLIDAEVTQ